MTAYAVLPRAGGNRVFGAAAVGLTRAELAFVDQVALGAVFGTPAEASMGGVPYVVVERQGGPLGALDRAALSNLSNVHALFEIEGDLLRPLEMTPRQDHDDDLVTIQRYVGKTNEQFTHLLLNVTLAAAGDTLRRVLVDGDTARLLDPVSGRGTTLHRAVLYGMDAAGVEVSRRDVEAHVQFFTTWLQDQRLKHSVDTERHRKGRDKPVSRTRIAYGPDRKGPMRTVEVVNDDTVHAADHFKARSFDVVVADLPYGVQHRNRPAGGDGPAARRPAELLGRTLPVWRDLLRPGGAMGLAWNRRTLGRDDMLDAVERAGLEPCPAPWDDAFVHRVDRTITRDLVVARRP